MPRTRTAPTSTPTTSTRTSPPPPPQATKMATTTTTTAEDSPTNVVEKLRSRIDHDQVMGHRSIHQFYSSGVDEQRVDEHAILRRRPLLWAAVGVSQTFLTAIMFGWASLVPVLRAEGINFTPSQLSQIFTCGAVGNYLATLPFGLLLDLYGPKTCGIIASLLYMLGLFLCGYDDHFLAFCIGFGLVGLSRPGIQLPTLHLSNLFEGRSNNGSGGTGGAVYMSCQAAAFDAGTAIFALMNLGYFQLGLKSGTMFWMYMVVPAWTLATAIWVWPNETLEKEDNLPTTVNNESDSVGVGVGTVENDDDNDIHGNDSEMDSSIGSPYLSPKQRKRLSNSQRAYEQQQQQSKTKTKSNSRSFWRHHDGLINAPLRQVLTHVSFYALSTWVGMHIYKLNFIVATINDQLLRMYSAEDANWLINVLGAMLPFGFVVLPIVSTLLHHQPMVALQVANVVGIIYGGVMVFVPQVTWLQILVVFPAVATSRQLVYSTLFHTIAKVFGFSNYGVLLGLTNAIASLFQTLQTPMVNWSERSDSYLGSNMVLWIFTFPLLFTVLYADPQWTPAWRQFLCGSTPSTVDNGSDNNFGDSKDERDADMTSETTMLLGANPQDSSMGKPQDSSMGRP